MLLFLAKSDWIWKVKKWKNNNNYSNNEKRREEKKGESGEKEKQNKEIIEIKR